MFESTIDDEFVMPISCCDDYDWEDNNTSYNLGNLFGTWLKEYDNNVCYTIGAIHAIDKNIVMICKTTSLGMLCLMSMKC